MDSLKWWIVVPGLLLLVILAYLWTTRTGGTPTIAHAPLTTTTLDMTILGGFTYVHSAANKTYDVAFLNQVSNGTCQVPKTKVTLKVLDGTITSPSPPPANNSFDLDGAVVTFSGASSGAASGTGPGTLTGNDRPSNPNDPRDWEDLKWVPNVFQKFPGSPIPANWRTLPVVNGRVVLTDGKLKGGKPTDPGAVPAVWDFKRKNAPGSPVFTQAITNETLYQTKLTGSSVTITLTRGSGATQIVVAANNGHVELSLMGEHPNAPPTLPAGAPIEDFCAFYEILQSPPAVADRLLPHFMPPASPAGGTGNPLPGPLCGGDYGEQP